MKSVSNGHYYIGSCGDVDKRVQEHNSGVTKSTKNKGPWEINFFQKYDTIREARQIEYKLKKLKRKDYLEEIIKEGKIRKK